MVEAVAGRVANSRRARRAGAEYDDLVQEGLIDVWQSLGRGIAPSSAVIENRMRDYIRWLGGQIGVPRSGCGGSGEQPCPQHIPYETLLPLDDFRVVQAG